MNLIENNLDKPINRQGDLSLSDDQAEIARLLEENEDLKEKNAYLKKELNRQYEKRESELLSLLNLQHNLEQTEKRYLALKESTLGKMTLFYWKLRKKLRKAAAK